MRIRTTGLLAMVMVLMAVAGCDGDKPAQVTESSRPTTVTGDPVVVLVAEPVASALRPFAEQASKELGVPVQIEVATGDTRATLLERVRSGRTPDLVAGQSVWLGDLVKAGAVAPLNLSGGQRDGINAQSLRAMSATGQLYGLPYAYGSVAMIRNSDLVPAVPRTFEEAVAIGRQLVQAGVVTRPIAVPVGEAGDPYAIHPLFASAGGSLLTARSNGEKASPSTGPWDEVKELGLGKAESTAAMVRLAGFGQAGSASGGNALTTSLGTADAVKEFAAGRTPFLVADPQVLPALATVPFELDASTVPVLHGGKQAQPLLSVDGFYLGAKGANPVAAQRFAATYLTRVEVAKAVAAADGRLAAVEAAQNAQIQDDAKFQQESRSQDRSVLRECAEASKIAVVPPATPNLAQVLASFGKAGAATVGGADPTQAVGTAVSEISVLLGH